MTPTAAAPGSPRSLWLLRHAKAATDPPPGGTDHERPLTARGRSDAFVLAQRLNDGTLGPGADDVPVYVLSSTAARAIETAELVRRGLDGVLDRRRQLYGGSPEDVVRELQSIPDEVRSVLVVGHNPTVELLAFDLLVPDDTDGRAALERKGFPTCALACLRLAARRWEDVAPGTANLTAFVTPPY